MVIASPSPAEVEAFESRFPRRSRHVRHRTTRRLAAAIVFLSGLAACSAAGAKEHQRRAAEFLLDTAAGNGVRLHDAQCVEPTSTQVDSTFECIAADEDGIMFTFIVTIIPDGYRIDPKL